MGGHETFDSSWYDPTHDISYLMDLGNPKGLTDKTEEQNTKPNEHSTNKTSEPNVNIDKDSQTVTNDDEESKNPAADFKLYPDKSDVINEKAGYNDNNEFSIGTPIDNNQDGLKIPFPDYGYDRYVTDIANWQKQRTTLGGDPGYFFFKVFFNFNTNYGLLGGIMSNIDSTYDVQESNMIQSTNTAFGYLTTLVNNYRIDRIEEKMLALTKFASTLKDISLRTPWLIKTVSGLNTVNSTYVNDFDKERTITLGFTEDTTDARFGTLLDLYKFACFDQMNCREVIPANLRKFEMSIMVYQMPIKYYNTKVVVSRDYARKMSSSNVSNGMDDVSEDYDGALEAKKTTIDAGQGNNFGDLMSFKLFTFLNCEIETNKMNEYYVDGMSNELPFKLGGNQISIKYDRVYEHRMNEWIEMMFGSDGIQFNNTVPPIFAKHPLTKDNISKFYINPTDSPYDETNSISQYRQRADALMDKWYGERTIADYTSLLIAKYYAPSNYNPPSTSTRDLYINKSGILNGLWSAVKNNMTNAYYRYRSQSQQRSAATQNTARVRV